MPKNAKGKGHKAAAVPVTSQASQIPAPWVVPAARMQPFLAQLDAQHIYLTHIDDHPTRFKRQLFGVPSAMNAALVGVLLVRAWTIAPYYYLLLLTLWGHHTPYWIDVKNTGWNIVLDQIVRRTLTLLLDLFLVRFVGQWPYDFFARPGSPVAWRWSVGFRRQEIAVRRSRPWDATLPRGWWKDEANDAVPDRIAPAVNPAWLRQKSAYLMLDRSWDLDFHGMIQAHGLVDTHQLVMDDFRTQVLVHTDEHGWLVWPVWTRDESADPGHKITAFKDALTRMGKEHLFFRWIEIVQFESSQPGGFTADRQARAMADARALFEEQGVDFDQFWTDIGGTDGLPGMEQQPS